MEMIYEKEEKAPHRMNVMAIDLGLELEALLHDIAMPSEIGPREEYNVYGAKTADELLTKLNYPEDRKERVKECVLRHRGSKDLPRNTVEEQCVADTDVIAHFDCIHSLFHSAFDKKLKGNVNRRRK